VNELLFIEQGTDQPIVATDVRIDGQLVDMTGWSVRAVIRQGSTDGPVVAEWSSDPTGSQGQATAGNGTVSLEITPDMSSAWTWRYGVVQAEATEPGQGGRKARVIKKTVYLDPEAVI